jgi:CelD/BcsL family acetyltransferase involved in cellulose biosynthesis
VLSTRLINGDAVFTELALEWDALAEISMTNTPFQSLTYQRAWWQRLGPTEGSLHTITAHNEADQLVAVACFYLVNGILYFNGCVEETDYLDLIAPAALAEAAWSAVFDRLCNPDFPDWTALDLCNVPEASPTRAILHTLAQRRGFSLREKVQEVCPIIHLPATFDAYLESLDKKQRHEIRRKLRRATAAGVTFQVVGPDDDLPQAVDDFLELLQKSTLEKRAWLNNGRRAVFHETAQAAMEAGTLQLLFVAVEGQKAAALFNFDYNGRIWVYNSGLDPAAFSSLSVGVVLTARAIEMAIANGRTAFDFLRGNEPYKYRFGAEDTSVYRIQLQYET